MPRVGLGKTVNSRYCGVNVDCGAGAHAAFAQDMKKSNIPLRPIGGRERQRLIRETYTAPEKMLERLRAAVTP
jgi:hypothetical protein